MREPIVYENVELGEGVELQPGVIVGLPPRGREPGELVTTIGARFQSGHGAMVRENNQIGDDCSVGTNAVLEPGNRVGDRTRIHSNCFLENVVLGSGVFLGPNVVFTDDPHPACPRYLDCVLGATVEDDVSIGANSTVLPGVRIGRGALVGAGSVVTKDVQARAVVAGNPARHVKDVGELVCFKGYFERPYAWRAQPSQPS